MDIRLSNKLARFLVVWRFVYGLILCILSLGCVFLPGELGPEPGWYLLFLGVLPTITVLVLGKFKQHYLVISMLVHDIALLCILVVLLAVLPNYLGLLVLSPLSLFLVEGVLVFLFCFTQITRR